jgi:hypothetical protein
LNPRATEQPHQKGLCLVILVVSKQKEITLPEILFKHSVARIASILFRGGIGAYRNRMKLNIQLRSYRAAMFDPIGGVDLQIVINV